MTETNRRLRVVIVGAGRRVRNSFLPALACLQERFDVQAIVSPNPDRRDLLASQWGIESASSLSNLNLANFDVAAVSVPSANNAAVFRDLSLRGNHLRVVVDTPIARNRKEFGAIASYLSQFKQVAVAEDYMNFPSLALVRDAVSSGLIGNLKWLTLNNTGYFYHGLAYIRSFNGFSKVLATKSLEIGDRAYSVVYDLGKYKASVIGPYRGHLAGGLVAKGSGGAITEFPGDVAGDGKAAQNKFLMSSIVEGGAIRGFAIEAGSRSMSIHVPEYAAMAGMDFPDKSALNLERGCGLIRVFKSIVAPDGLNDRYGADDAIYDRLVSSLATRGRLPFDPLARFNSSVLEVYRQAARLG